MNAAQKAPTAKIEPPATLLPAPPTSLPPTPLPTTGPPGPARTAPTSEETTAWTTKTLDALAAGGGDMPFLDIPDTTEETTVEHQRLNADTQAHMLATAGNSFEDWAERNDVPVDCGPLAGTIRAYAPAIVAGEERLAVDVQRSGCVTLPPREELSSTNDRTASAAAGRTTVAKDLVYIRNGSASVCTFDGLNPKSDQARRNADDLRKITSQAAALDMCFNRMREIRDLARRPGTNAAGLSWMKRWRQFTAEVVHVEWVRWVWIKGSAMTWVECRQEEGLMSLFAAYISKRVDTYSSLLQAVGHVFTWFLMNLQLAAPPMPYLRRFLKWCEKRMGQEVPFRKQRNALEPRHVLGIRQHWMDRARRYFRDQEFNRAAYFVNLLLALLAGVTYGFRTTELCPGKLFFLREASQTETDAMSTICANSLYWERRTFASFANLIDGDAQCIAPMWRKTSGTGNRERQERLNQAIPFVRQDSNPINFPANYIHLLEKYDRTPEMPPGVDIAIPAFRNTLKTTGVEAPALDPVTFQKELVAAVEICFPTEADTMVFGDAAMRMCATISWFMAGATEADQRAMGTWTSGAFHLYNMAPLEHMAFLQLHANAAQFTTANSLRKHTELPVISAAEINAASRAATAARADKNDFGLAGLDIYSDSDEESAESIEKNMFTTDMPQPAAERTVHHDFEKHTALCAKLESSSETASASGEFFKLDVLSVRLEAESATTAAQTRPEPGPILAGPRAGKLPYLVNRQRPKPSQPPKASRTGVAPPEVKRGPGRPKHTLEQKTANKREREKLADEAYKAHCKRLRQDFQAHLNKGRRGAAQPSPAVEMTQTDQTTPTDTLGSEMAAPGEVQTAELPEDHQGQEDIDPDTLLTQMGLQRLTK